jgi:hypothetical protein
MHIGIVEAWSQWAAGTLSHDSHLWGLNILWWGRIGKVLELLSGAIIVADIMGPDRLRQYGQRFGELVSSGTLNAQSVAVLALIRDSLLSFFWYGDRSREATDRLFEAKHRWLYLIVTLIIGITIFNSTRGNAALIVGLIAGVFFCLAMGAILAPFVLALLVLGVVVVVAVLNQVLAKPFGSFLLFVSHDKAVKGLGLALLLIGFHFDFLAS